MRLETPKGTKDYPPEEKIVRDALLQTLTAVFQQFGFSPLETPIVEHHHILAAKFGAGSSSDVMKEIFTLQDQGKRKLGLRYELTFPLARFVGMNPTLKFPFKRYQIGPVFRDGPIKLGRMRQFYQCDIDTVGASGMHADAEILAIAAAVAQQLKLRCRIEINHRKILNGILSIAGIPEKNQIPVLVAIDKLKKIGWKGLQAELTKLHISPIQQQSIRKYITQKSLRKMEAKETAQGVEELMELFTYLNQYNVNYTFTPTLARGLAYYTGPIYEVYAEQSIIASAIAGGGRWDNMIGSYLNAKDAIPATGMSFGLEPLLEMQKQKPLTPTSVYIIHINTELPAITLTQSLRKAGINTEVDLMQRNLSRNLDYANKKKIPYVIILGKQELAKRKYKLRDMRSGTESLLTVSQVKKKLSRLQHVPM